LTVHKADILYSTYSVLKVGPVYRFC